MPPLSALSVPGGFVRALGCALFEVERGQRRAPEHTWHQATKTLIGFCGLAGCFGFVMAETAASLQIWVFGQKLS